MTVEELARAAGRVSQSIDFHRATDRPLPVRVMHFLLAPWVDRWTGWSLTRLLATWIACWVIELAHDWLKVCLEAKAPPGAAFVSFVVGGFLLAVCTALGGKYILAFINAKELPTGPAIPPLPGLPGTGIPG